MDPAISARRAFALIALALVVASPGTASASGTQIAPEFSRDYEHAACHGGLYGPPPPGACVLSADAQRSGDLDLSLHVTTPLDGRLPGPAGAYADMEIAVEHDLRGITARFLVYTVELYVADAAVRTSARPLSRAGQGSIVAGVYASIADGGLEDGDSAWRPLVDGSGDWAAPSRSQETFTMGVVLGDGQTRTFDGRAAVGVWVSANANTSSMASTEGIPRGSTDVTLDAQVVSVRFEAVA